jgi:hydrogenase maturation protease
MLENWLQERADKTILFVGIGNVLKKDDGVGVYVTRHLKDGHRIQALTVEVSIENYIGKINALRPDLLVLVDCMDLQRSPGAWDLMAAERISGYTTNTHNISLNRVSELFHAPVYILGIQPLDISLGEGLSQPVRATARRLIGEISRGRTKPVIR